MDDHLPEYERCPTCPACGSRTLVPAESYAGRAGDLHCAVCRWTILGAPEQSAQAKRAEDAWNGRTDDRKGPWLRVLRARAKHEKNQLRLFDAERMRSSDASEK